MPHPSTASIRPADLGRPEDGEALLRLLDAYSRDAMGAGAPLPETVRSTLVGALRAVPGHLVLLAFEGDEPVGIAVCFRGFSTFQARPLLNVHDLAVVAQSRARGIGRALLRAVESQARELGCCKVTLEVREDNPGALALYRSLGFGAARSGEHVVQYLFLEKRLQD